MWRSYIDEFMKISRMEVVKNGGLVEIGQVGHVLALRKLRRVNLLNLILLQDPLLFLVRSWSQGHLDGDLVAVGRVDDALDETAFLERNPAWPLRIVGLKMKETLCCLCGNVNFLTNSIITPFNYRIGQVSAYVEGQNHDHFVQYRNK